MFTIFFPFGNLKIIGILSQILLYDKGYSNKFKFFNYKNNPMKIYVNGQQKNFEATEICLTSLIEKLALNEKKFAIEYNGEIISKSNFSQTFLKEGDKLEIVVAVGGG